MFTYLKQILLLIWKWFYNVQKMDGSYCSEVVETQRIAMNRSARDFLIVLTIATSCFFINLGGPHLWDRDEPRNAGCAAEMLAANDWVVPTFNAELRDHKPVLTYWFMMVSYLAFGVTEFAARFPSALLGVGTTMLTFFLGRRLFSPSAGLWSAIALSTTMMFGVASRAATPDAPLIFFSTLAIAIYVWGTTSAIRDEEQRELFPSKWSIVAAMYLAMGLAVLAKGPVGVILPTAVIGMFLLIKRLQNTKTESASSSGFISRIQAISRPFAPIHFLKTCWSMRPVTAVLCVLAVALPWYVLVHLKTDGEWTYGFFVKHNVGRAMDSMDGHRGNVLFYPIALIVGFFPWSTFWIPTLLDGIRQLKAKSKWGDGYLFAFCWIGVYLCLFSIAKTKLPSYITPCYPGMALAVGVFLDRWSQGDIALSKTWRRLAFGSLIVVGAGVLTAIPIAAKLLVPDEAFLGLLGFIPVTGGIVALLAAEKGKSRRAILTTAVSAILMSPAIFAFAAAEIDDHRQIDRLVEMMYRGEEIDAVDLISFSSTEASWIFYARQPIERFMDPEEASVELMKRSPLGQPRVLVTTEKRMKKLEPFLLENTFTIQQMPYFLEETDIVVLRPNSEIVQTTGEEHVRAVR